MLIKKHQSLVVRATLKRIFPEATNMAAAFRAEEIKNTSNSHFACVILSHKRTVTTNADICEVFRDYIRERLTREPDLKTAQFDTYLDDFRRMKRLGARVPLQNQKSGKR